MEMITGMSIELEHIVIVGAPNSSSLIPSHQNLKTPGAVYRCDIGIPNSCKEYVIEDKGNTVQSITNLYSYKDRKDDGLLGATVDGGENVGDPFFTCSPRWKNDRQDRSGQHYLSQGICYEMNDSADLNSESERMMPLLNAGKQGYTLDRVVKYYYAMGQVGLSMNFIKEKSELLLGAPGLLGWRGSVLRTNFYNSNFMPPQQLIRNERVKRQSTLNTRIPNPVYISSLKNDNYYFGYSVSSGRFVASYTDLWYISGSPRAEDLYGMVLLFEFPNFDDADLIVHKKVVGEQLGSYFGGSVLGVSTTGKRNRVALADLLVGAPSYVIDTWDEGCVYFYRNDGNGNFESPVKLLGNKQPGARFGTALSPIGDLNKDSYEDVAISAPYENENGVIYIYLGGRNGLNTQYSQRITGSSIKHSIRGFGFSLSRGVDIDQNFYNDIAVGAYKSGEVAIIKSRPVIKYFANFTSNVRELSVNTSKVNIEYCVNYTTVTDNVKNVNTEITLIKDFRAIDKNDIKKTVTLDINSRFCENLTISIQEGTFDYTNAFTVELTYEISNERHQKFCPLCPVTDPSDTKSTTLNVPFANGCGDDNICKPDLKLTVALEDDTNPLIIGLLNTLKLKVRIENHGEPAYLCQIFMILPEDVEVQRISSRCEFNDDRNYECIVSDVLQPDTMKEMVFDLDVKKINPIDQQLYFNLSVTSRGEDQNENDNIASITVPLSVENSLEISGISYPDSIIFVNESNQINAETVLFTHEYVIKNLGPSPMSNISVSFYFPVVLLDDKLGNQKAFDVYEPEVIINNQIVQCTTDHPLGFYVDTFNGSESDFTDQQRFRRKRETIPENENSLDDSIDALGLPINRTISINYKSNNIESMKIMCSSTKVIGKQQFMTAKFVVKAHIDILTLLTFDKDIILFKSTAEATSNYKPTQYHVPTVLIGSVSTGGVSYWVYVGCVLIAVFILCVIVLILYKLNFFSRPVREKLHNEADSTIETKTLDESSANEEEI